MAVLLLDVLLAAMSPLELIAAAFGLVCVWLTTRQNIWCWPTGLVMTALYVVIFYRARLYSDVLLQVVFVVMQVYGWWYWLRGGERSNRAPVRRILPAAALGWAAVIVLGVAGLGTLMDRTTDADLAYWDATTTVLSLVAQWLMGRKVLESWGLWITVDVLAVGIYAYKGLFVTTGLYAVFLVLAVAGLATWHQSWQQQRAVAPDAVKAAS